MLAILEAVNNKHSSSTLLGVVAVTDMPVLNWDVEEW